MGFNTAGAGCLILKLKQQNHQDVSVQSEKSTSDSSASSCSSAPGPLMTGAQGSGPAVVQGTWFIAPAGRWPVPLRDHGFSYFKPKLSFEAF